MTTLLKRLIFLPAMLFVALISCSSNDSHPYTTIEGDPYATRLYRLGNSIKLFITHNEEEPRAAVALSLPSVGSCNLKSICTQSTRSKGYHSLFATIGTEPCEITEIYGSTIVSNDIPCNELENWATIMRGSFTSLPDSTSIIISGDVDYDTSVDILEKAFASTPLTPSQMPAVEREKADIGFIQWLDSANGTLGEAKRTYNKALAFGMRQNSFRLFAIAEATLRGAPWNDAYNRIKRLSSMDDGCFSQVSSRHIPHKGEMPDTKDGAENSIELLPSPPAPVIFPDEDRLNISIKNDTKQIIYKDCDSLFSFALRYEMGPIPPSFIAITANSLNKEIEGSATAIGNTLQLYIDGVAKEQQQEIEKLHTTLTTLTHEKRLYKLLLNNKSTIDSTKRNPGNIATQFALYINKERRIQGMSEAAASCKATLTAPPAEILYSGCDPAKSAFSTGNHTPAEEKRNPDTAPNDTATAIYLLPLDREEPTIVIATEPITGTEEQAAALIFNKASTLAGASSQYHNEGAYLHSTTSDGAKLPFTREEFDAAKAYLLYAYSTKNGKGHKLAADYSASSKRGYTTAELYDALFALDYSDIKEFHERQCESAKARLIVGRQSDIDQQKLSQQGGITHLTSDELFGY